MLAAIAAEPRLTWNLVDDIRQLFEFPFMVNAFRAGTLVAITAGLVGWFMVLRRQSFAGHTLALIGFPGAAGAVLVGVSAQLGFFAFCIGGAVVIAVLPRSGRFGFGDESAVIGTVQAFALASGYLFVTLHGGNLNGINALLFGSIIGVTEADVARVLIAAITAIVLVGVIARPLLFASIDPDVATARGVPVRWLSIGFAVLLGVAAAASTQVTGALLVFALLVLPAATAQTLTARPAVSIVLSVGLAVVITWVGLGVAYYSPYPIGFWITSFAFAIFLMARVTSRVRDRLGWRPA
jgi:zinc/manganese transport system permease protein